jgi:hypothetical protein
MVVMRWRGVLRLFHGNPQHPQQTHRQRFGAMDVAFLRGRWLIRGKLKRSTLSEGWDAPFGRKRSRSAPSNGSTAPRKSLI